VNKIEEGVDELSFMYRYMYIDELVYSERKQKREKCLVMRASSMIMIQSALEWWKWRMRSFKAQSRLHIYDNILSSEEAINTTRNYQSPNLHTFSAFNDW